MKLYFLLPFSLLFCLVGCTSVNNYIKTRKSEYRYSQNFDSLKIPSNLKLGPTQFIIPMVGEISSTEPPKLYPPTD